MEPRISLITLGVKNLQREIEFYRDGLGFPLSNAGGDGVAFFQLGGLILSLYPREDLAADAQVSPEGSGFAAITLAHNVRSRGEVDTVMARAVEAGATVLKPAGDIFWGGYIGYFADPDGFVWEVAWNPHFPISDDGAVHLPV